MLESTEQAVYTVNDICRVSPLSPYVVRNLIKTGRLPAVKVGRQFLIRRSALETLFPDAFRGASNPRVSTSEIAPRSKR